MHIPLHLNNLHDHVYLRMNLKNSPVLHVQTVCAAVFLRADKTRGDIDTNSKIKATLHIT